MPRYEKLGASHVHVAPVSVPKEIVPNVVLGMVVMSFAMLLVPLMDVIAKYLGSSGGGFSSGVVTFGRFAVQAMVLGVLMLILVMVRKRKSIWPRNIAGNLLRGGLMGAASFMFFTAVTFMPVADAIAVFFIEPLVLTLLSGFLLGEVVGWRRRIAVMVGFAGSLLIIQPSFSDVGSAAFLPVIAAFVFAFYLILTRQIASGDDPFAMQFAAGIGGVIFMAACLALGSGFSGVEQLQITWPDKLSLWLLLLLVGLIGTGSHLMIVYAFARAPAAILAPFQYIEIISATVFGYWIFKDFPNAIKWFGIAILVISGIYIFWREAQLSKQEK